VRPEQPARELTRFFGRKTELTQLNRLLESTRLVTIAGPPGAGTTRMSREFAARIASSFADGVVLAELASAVSVQAAVDAALGEPLEDSADLLIILDNCEHLVTAAAEVAARILTACRSRSSSQRPGATSPTRLMAAGSPRRTS